MKENYTNVIVTGCNTGLGFELIKELGINSSKLIFVVMAVRDINKGISAQQELEKQIPGFSKRSKVMLLDISKSTSIHQFAEMIKSQNFKIDCLINNAAVAFKGDAITYDIAEEVIRTNFFGTVELVDNLFEMFNTSGKIINISGGSARIKVINSSEYQSLLNKNNLSKEELFVLANKYLSDVKGQAGISIWPPSSYLVSKIFLNVYTKIISRNLNYVNKNIQIYCCHPGWLRTRMGGEHAISSPSEGTKCPLYLFDLPWTINPLYQGGFFDEASNLISLEDEPNPDLLKGLYMLKIL